MFGRFRKKKAELNLSLVTLSGDGFRAIVGESHCQDALQATRGVCTGTFEGRPMFKAALVREWENPHDPNAVAVWSPRGRLGYLSRADALAYRELFDEIKHRGHDGGSCDAWLTGGEPDKPSHGAVLRLGSPEVCLDELRHATKHETDAG